MKGRRRIELIDPEERAAQIRGEGKIPLYPKCRYCRNDVTDTVPVDSPDHPCLGEKETCRECRKETKEIGRGRLLEQFLRSEDGPPFINDENKEQT